MTNIIYSLLFFEIWVIEQCRKVTEILFVLFPYIMVNTLYLQIEISNLRIHSQIYLHNIENRNCSLEKIVNWWGVSYCVVF